MKRKHKNQTHGSCTAKQWFSSEAEALRAIETEMKPLNIAVGRAYKSRHLRAYKCENCGKYHITSMPIKFLSKNKGRSRLDNRLRDS